MFSNVQQSSKSSGSSYFILSKCKLQSGSYIHCSPFHLHVYFLTSGKCSYWQCYILSIIATITPSSSTSLFVINIIPFIIVTITCIIIIIPWPHATDNLYYSISVKTDVILSVAIEIKNSTAQTSDISYFGCSKFSVCYLGVATWILRR